MSSFHKVLFKDLEARERDFLRRILDGFLGYETPISWKDP